MIRRLIVALGCQAPSNAGVFVLLRCMAYLFSHYLWAVLGWGMLALLTLFVALGLEALN